VRGARRWPVRGASALTLRTQRSVSPELRPIAPLEIPKGDLRRERGKYVRASGGASDTNEIRTGIIYRLPPYAARPERDRRERRRAKEDNQRIPQFQWSQWRMRETHDY
jgi:hypothetical protein